MEKLLIVNMDSGLFVNYVNELITGIPLLAYEIVAVFFIIGLMIFIACYGFKRGLQKSSVLLLLEYLFILYGSTVLFRETGVEHKYDLQPFWSYKAIEAGSMELLLENIMNVVVFVPLGFLLGLAFKIMTFSRVLLIGVSISISIETLQYVLMRGLSELNDVIHNTIGCLIGFLFYQFFSGLYKKLKFVVRW